jgi:Tfp pilus assembly protein PilX
MRRNTTGAPKDENGFAAIIIAIILVLVLSLITVGFAQLMGREQRQALDRQLSSQAYYAAESGLNDAIKAISAGYPYPKKTCNDTDVHREHVAAKYLINDRADKTTTVGDATNDTGASITCLLIDPVPNSLEFKSIDTAQSKTTQLNAVNASGTVTNIGTVEISWQDANDSQDFVNNNCDSFYPASGGSPNWPATGVLRAQLIALHNSSGSYDLSRTGLIKQTSTVFLCPQEGGGTPGSVDYANSIGTAGGPIVSGNCRYGTRPKMCSARITNLAPLHESTFFLNMRSIYNPTKVTVRVFDASNNQLYLEKAQILIDSTGKAQDVVRRLQARVSANPSYDMPDGVSAGDICKQLNLRPGAGSSGCDRSD